MEALLARTAIVDCLHRYTRGVDRVDEQLVRSAYHADAVDVRGPDGAQSVDELIATWRPKQEVRRRTQHCTTNSLIELAGTTAHAETYWLCLTQHAGRVDGWLIGGRYLDRLEQRDGEWRIAKRVVTQDWWAEAGPVGLLGPEWARRDRGDLSYTRPLADPV